MRAKNNPPLNSLVTDSCHEGLESGLVGKTGLPLLYPIGVPDIEEATVSTSIRIALVIVPMYATLMTKVVRPRCSRPPRQHAMP